jgi:hypothetical protein
MGALVRASSYRNAPRRRTRRRGITHHRAEMTDNKKGSFAMGDKGKKDKEKGQKQKTVKQGKKLKKKLDKQEKKTP